MSRRNQRHAFTLVELLVVIAIIGILISLLIPTLRSAREEAYATGSGPLVDYPDRRGHSTPDGNPGVPNR